MRKLFVVIPFDTFDWGIEITEFNMWKFFLDNFHHLMYTIAFARISHTNITQIPVRVDIEIAPLDKIQFRVLDGFQFQYYPDTNQGRY